jgi:murein DD-endopeptidase MepM/ murein hydrolase activator NlpD
MPSIDDFKKKALESGYTQEELDGFLGSLTSPTNESGYDPTGKTYSQVMAETCRQSLLDQMGTEGFDVNQPFGDYAMSDSQQQMDQPAQSPAPSVMNDYAPLQMDQAPPATQSAGMIQQEPVGPTQPQQPTFNDQLLSSYKDFAVKSGEDPALVEELINKVKTEGFQSDQTETMPQEGAQATILGASAPVTQRFGNYNPGVEVTKSGINYGTDIAVKKGTPIAAPEGEWEVVKAFDGASVEGPRNRERMVNQGYGNSVMIQNKETGEKMRFSHLGVGDVFVKPGDVVKGGTVLGKTGASGNTAGRTGQHLDLEYYDPKGNISNVEKTKYWRQLMPSG